MSYGRGRGGSKSISIVQADSGVGRLVEGRGETEVGPAVS